MNKHRQMMCLLICSALSAVTLCSCVRTDGERAGANVQAATEPQQASGLTITTAKVESHKIARDLRIPAELMPFREIVIYSKGQGFVHKITVDRGSSVQKGELLVQVVAPELEAQLAEARAKAYSARSSVAEVESKVQSLIAQSKEAEATLGADQALSRRIRQAAETPGAVAPYDLEQIDQKIQVHKARIEADSSLIAAAKSDLNAQKGKLKAAEQSQKSAEQILSYLMVHAPFDGVITERNVHEGSLVMGTNSPAMLKLEQKSLLRLLVPIPEAAVAGMKEGTQLSFTVPAFSSKNFVGVVHRISHVLDRKTRSMIVEADVENTNGQLEPGMYADVAWRMVAPESTLLVPSSAIKSAEGKSVIFRISDGTVQEVPISCKQSMGDMVEIVGDVKEGEEVAVTAIHELKPGTKVTAHIASSGEPKGASESQDKHGG